MTEYPQYPTEGNNPYGGSTAPGAPATGGARPASAALAVKLLWGAVALYLVGGIVSLSMGGSVVGDQLTAQGASAEQAEAFASAALVIGGVVIVVLLGVFVLLTVFVGKGANWARITTTVLTAIGALVTVPSLFTMGSESNPVVSALLSLAQIALCVVAVVFLFRADSNAWFSAPKVRS